MASSSRAGAPTRRRCCSVRSPRRAPAGTKPTWSRPTARSSRRCTARRRCSRCAEKVKQRGAPVEWFAIAPAIGRANGVGIVQKPPHPRAAQLFVDFLLSPEGQTILQKGGYVPANLRVEDRAQKLPLKFVDP